MTPEELKYYSHPKMQEKFPKDWIYGDKYLLNIPGIGDEELVYVCGGQDIDKLKNAIRLPLSIDPVNPERGLWGMVDWSKSLLRTTLSSKVVAKVHKDDGWVIVYEGKSTSLALLNVLAHQWWIEVAE